MKLTKTRIEELANEIIAYLKANDLDMDVCVYFNNKRIRLASEWNRETKELVVVEKIEEDMNPLDYFSYANEKHILSMSFEGGLYHKINYECDTEEFDAIFKKYGLYYEQGHAWNLSAYPDTIDYDDIEYTSYETEPESEPIKVYSHSTDVPMELLVIKHMWDKLSATTEHLGGSITMGDGFNFEYKGNRYKMVTPNYQGSMIYEHWISTIKQELKTVGATDVYYDYGRMD